MAKSAKSKSVAAGSHSDYPRFKHSYSQQPADNNSKPAGSVDFLQQVLNFYNVFFMFAGFGVLGVGLWAILDKQHYASLIVSTTYAVAAYLLIAAGCLVFIAAVIGFVGICQLRKGCVLVYLILLILIFLVEMAAGFLAYYFANEMNSHLKTRLKDIVENDYGKDASMTGSFDLLQQGIGCCGSEDFRDWGLSAWGKEANISLHRSKKAGFVPVPDSCCKNSTATCGFFSHPSNIFYDGCAPAFANFLREHLYIIGGVGIGVCAVQLFGAILSCCLCSKLTQQKKLQSRSELRYTATDY